MKKVFDLCDALTLLCPNSSFTIKNGIVEWVNPPTHIPTETEIQTKIAELEAAEPMKMLRLERDQLIAATDWRATVDYPGSDQAAWLTYRQALRDLPANSTPSLDDNGQLTGVTWPTPPE